MLSIKKKMDMARHVSCTVFSWLLGFLIPLVFIAGGFAQDDSIRFEIPSQDVQTALDAFVETTNFSLIYRREGFRNLITSEVSGQYSPEQALNIMLEGTGLAFEFTSRDTVAIIQNENRHSERQERPRRTGPD